MDGTQEHFFYEQKQNEILNGKGHKKRSSAELQPFVNLKSNTMKNTVQKYLFYPEWQNTRLKKNALQHTLTTKAKYSKQLTEFIK